MPEINPVADGVHRFFSAIEKVDTNTDLQYLKNRELASSAINLALYLEENDPYIRQIEVGSGLQKLQIHSENYRELVKKLPQESQKILSRIQKYYVESLSAKP